MTITAPITIKAGTWYQVTCSLDAQAKTMSIWVNGTLQAKQSFSTVYFTDSYDTETVGIGDDPACNIGDGSADCSTFDGFISNVQIYQHAMGGN